MTSSTVAPRRALTRQAGSAPRILVTAVGRLRRVPWPLLVFLASAATVAVALLTRVELPIFAPLRHYGFFDLKIYRRAAGVVLSGDSLYSARFRLGLGFTYPPAAAVIFTALRLVSLRVDEILVTLLNLALLPVIARCTLRLAPGADGAADEAGRARLVWLAAAVAPWIYPVSGAIGFGQIDLLIAALVLVDLTYGREARWGGLLIGLAAALKLTPLIFIVYLLLCGRGRMAVRAVGGFALSVALAFDVTPGDASAYWTGGLFDTSRITGGGDGSGPADQSLHGAVLRLWSGLPHATGLWLAAGVLLGGAGLLLAARACRRGDERVGFVLAAVAGLLVSPISWPHHWVIALPGLVFLADAAGRRVRAGRRAHGWGIMLAVATLAAGSWAIFPPIAVAIGLRWPDLSLWGLLVADLYVLVGVATILTAAAVDLRVRSRPANHRPAAPPSRSVPALVGALRARAVSGSSRSPTPVPHPGRATIRPPQSSP